MKLGGNWNNGPNAGSVALNVNNDVANARNNYAAHNKANETGKNLLIHAFLHNCGKSSKGTRRPGAGARARVRVGVSRPRGRKPSLLYRLSY